MTRHIRFTGQPDDGTQCCFILLAFDHSVDAKGVGDTFTVTGAPENIAAFMIDMDSEFHGEVEVLD